MTRSYFELLSIEKPVVKIDQLIKSSIYKSNSISIVYLRYIRVFFIRYEKWFLVCIYVFSLEKILSEITRIQRRRETMIVRLQSNFLGTMRTYLSSRVHKFVTSMANGARLWSYLHEIDCYLIVTYNRRYIIYKTVKIFKQKKKKRTFASLVKFFPDLLLNIYTYIYRLYTYI